MWVPTELAREAASSLLFDHPGQVFNWGSLRGDEQGLRFAPELLYIGASSTTWD